MKKRLTVIFIKIVACLGILYGIFLIVSLGFIGLALKYALGFKVKDLLVNPKPILLVFIGLSFLVSGIYIFKKANWARIAFIVTLFIDLISDTVFLMLPKEPDMSNFIYVDLFVSIVLFIFLLLLFNSRNSSEYFLRE